MPTRSNSSEFQPAPPIARLRNPAGRNGGGIGHNYSAVSGVKPNVGAPPATNGERAFGKVAPSQPDSATKQMKVVVTL